MGDWSLLGMFSRVEANVLANTAADESLIGGIDRSKTNQAIIPCMHAQNTHNAGLLQLETFKKAGKVSNAEIC